MQKVKIDRDAVTSTSSEVNIVAYVLSSRMGIVVLILLSIIMYIVLAGAMDPNETDVTQDTVLKEIEIDAQAVVENLNLEGAEVVNDIWMDEGDSSQHFEDYTAKDLIELMSCAMDEVDTVRTVTMGNMNMSMMGSSELFILPLMCIDVNIYSEEEVNVTSSAGNIYMAMTMGSEELGDLFLMEMEMRFTEDLGYANVSLTMDSETEETEIYILGDSIYIKVDGVWEGMDLSEAEGLSELGDLQDMQDGQNMLTELSLDDYLAIELIGSEMIDGEDCYKLRMVPNTTGDISDLLGGQMGYTPEYGDDLDLSETYEDVDVTMEFEEILWISKETYLPKKQNTTGYIFESASLEDNTNIMIYLNLDSTTRHEYNQTVQVEEMEIPDFLKLISSIQRPREIGSSEVSKLEEDTSSSKHRPLPLGSFKTSMKKLSGVELSRQIAR